MYAIIGILAVAAASVTLIPKGPAPADNNAGNLADKSRQESIANFEKQFCGPGAQPNSNAFVTEKVLPSDCEMPLGITVDNQGNVWYASTKKGTLGRYDSQSNKFEEFLIPDWPTRSNPTEFSMVWVVKADRQGNIWLTDDKTSLLWRFNHSTCTFDSFKSPAVNPVSFDFDANGNMYLVGVRSKSLYFGDMSKIKPGTSEGFTEIKLPLEQFKGIDDFRVSSGSVAVDSQRGVVWTTVLAFQQKGQVFRYDVATQNIKVFDLPQELSSPVGTAVDGDGNLWVTDHGTSIFFKVDAKDGAQTMYVTSPSSPRIFGGTTPANAYTLPYWIQYYNGEIWFNQHQGNKISRFNPAAQTLTEYWIPTQNPLWANCPDNTPTCGVANALQFSIGGPQGNAWFTEWSQNKIGTVNAQTKAPLSISAPEQVTVKKGDSVQIRLDISSDKNLTGRMISAGTMSYTGGLGNSTGIFSEQTVSVGPGQSKQVSFVFTPADSLKQGQYVLMLGAEDDQVGVLKAVKVNVT